MSDIASTVDGGIAVDTPVETPDVAVTTDQATEAPVETGSDDATSSAAEQTFTLRDGREVTLEELESGYLRQSDYTRKTQELAKERQQTAEAARLWEALQSDPEGTLEALQRHLVGDVAQDTDLDPTEAQLREIQAFIEQQQIREAEAAVDAEIAQVKAAHGDFDAEALLEFAVERNIPNLEAALLLQRQEQAREEARRAGNERALSAKRGAPPVAGGSRAAGSTTAPSAPIKSVLDAWAAAKQELGYAD